MTPNPDKPEPRHDAYAALRVPNYRLFAAGFLVSSMGLQMLATALGWEIYERTESPLALGIVGLCRALPVILLALPAGHIIDRFDKQRVLILTQMAMAGVAAMLALASHNQWPLRSTYALVVLAGCARVFNGPARATLLPLIVPREIFGNASTWNSGVFHVSGAVGPVLAGYILHQFQAASIVYGITAAACVILAGSAAFLKPRESERSTGPFTLSSVTAGLSHVWREKTVLAAITLDLFAVLLGGATALLPVFAKDILTWKGEPVGEMGLGYLKAAPFVGAAIMAFFLAHRPPFKRAGLSLLWSVAGFGVCMIVFGLSENYLLSLAVLFLSGAVDNVSVVIRHVLVQVRTPEHLRGRVSSVNSVFIESSNELGAYESGAVAKYAEGLIPGVSGAMFSVVSGGIGTLVVVGLIAILIPAIRVLSLVHQEPPQPESRDDAAELESSK